MSVTPLGEELVSGEEIQTVLLHMDGHTHTEEGDRGGHFRCYSCSQWLIFYLWKHQRFARDEYKH